MYTVHIKGLCRTASLMGGSASDRLNCEKCLRMLCIWQKIDILSDRDVME